MFKHNLLLLFRSIKRNKSAFFINLIGLTSGLIVVLLIYMWVNNELQFDNFHEKDSQLYQVLSNYEYSTGIITDKATYGLGEIK